MDGDWLTAYAIAFQAIFVVVTVVLLGGAAFIKSLGQKNRTIMAVGGLVTAGMVIVSVMVPGGVVVKTQCELHPELPECANVKWTTLLATTYDADVDTTAEVLDSEGATACDGGTPDLNGAIATLATNGLIDESHGTLTLQSDMDKDLARTATALQEIDCPLMAVSIALTAARDANGDGTPDAVTWAARLANIGPATFRDGNLTTSNIVFWDPDFGWQCGFLSEGNIWFNAFGSSGRYASSMPSSGPWIDLGSHAGSGAAFDLGSFACVFDTTVGAPGKSVV